MNTKTQTVTTEGYPEAGPFETKEEATLAPVPYLGIEVILNIECRTDGWYKVYTMNSSTSVALSNEEWKRETIRRGWTWNGGKGKVKELSIECWQFARDVFKGRRREEG